MKIRKSENAGAMMRVGYAIYVAGWIAVLGLSAILSYLIPWLVASESSLARIALRWVGFLGPMLVYFWLSRLTGLQRTEASRFNANGQIYPPNASYRVRDAQAAIIKTGLFTGGVGTFVVAAVFFATWHISNPLGDRTAQDAALARDWLFATPAVFLVFAILGAVMRFYRALAGVEADQGN